MTILLGDCAVKYHCNVTKVATKNGCEMFSLYIYVYIYIYIFFYGKKKLVKEKTYF